MATPFDNVSVIGHILTNTTLDNLSLILNKLPCITQNFMEHRCTRYSNVHMLASKRLHGKR